MHTVDGSYVMDQSEVDKTPHPRRYTSHSVPSTQAIGSPGKGLEEFGQDFDSSDDEALAKLEVEARPWLASNYVIYVTDLAVQSCFNWSLFWRLPAIAFAVSIVWHDNHIGLLNFLVPYAICIAVIGWPMYLAELGMGQLVRGSSPKVFGSLNIASRFGGCGWMWGMFSAGSLSALAAFAFAMICESGSQNGLYFGAVGATRSCVKLEGWIPTVQPRLCLADPQSLEQACYSTDEQCSIWDSDGRCIAVPWGPASSEIIDSAATVVPWFQNDYPIYCGARHVHNVFTNSAYAVTTRQAKWGDYSSYLSWKLPVGFAIAWVSASAIALAKGFIGSFIRLGMGIYILVVFIMLFVCCITWFTMNPWSSSNWVLPMVTLNWRGLFSVEPWVHAIAQSCFAMGIGQNLVPPYAARSPSERNNIVITSTVVTVANFLFGNLILWLVLMAYGALSSWNYPIAGIQPLYGPIAFDIRNSALANIFTVFETLFDNVYGDRQFNGGDQMTYFWGVIWWLAICLVGIMALSRTVDQVSDVLYSSHINYRLVLPRWAYIVIVMLLGFGSTVYMWWGVGWATFVTFQHFLINLALPMMVLYQGVAIAWTFGWNERVRQFGRRAHLVQVSFFWIGLLGFSVVVGFLWDHETWWYQLIGIGISAAFMVLAVLIPPFITRDHDSYGKLNNKRSKWSNSFLGPIEHLRVELNYRTCHGNAFWRVPRYWSLCIKYCVPVLCIIPIFAFGSRAESWYYFSAYRPFFNDQRDIWSRVEIMFSIKELAMPVVWIAIFAAIAFFCIIFPLVALVFPKLMSANIPKDTDDCYWNVRNAGEIFAESVNASQAPVRVREKTVGSLPLGTQDAYGRVPKGLEPSFYTTDYSTVSHVPKIIAMDRDPSMENRTLGQSTSFQTSVTS